MPSIEYQILLAASDIEPGREQQQKLLASISHHFDQDRLVEMAVREGVAGLLYKNLKKIGVLGYLGHEQIEKLQSFYYSAVRENLRLLHDLKEILRKLRSDFKTSDQVQGQGAGRSRKRSIHGYVSNYRRPATQPLGLRCGFETTSNQSKTPVVLLQGIHLLQQIYQDIGLRPLTDIDLWVLPQHFAVVEKALAKLGYQNDPLYPKTFKRNSTLVDVNTHILWADRIKSRRFLITAGQEDIYRNCRFMDIEGETAQCLSRADQIIYLSLHAFKHNLDRLIWLADVKNLLAQWEASDWDALANRSKELGIIHVVSYILFYLDRLFEWRLPPEARTIYKDTKMGYLENHILQKRLQGKPLPAWGPLLILPSDKGLYRRVSFILENLFPRPQVLRQIFADTPAFHAWQLYLKRARQLLIYTKNN